MMTGDRLANKDLINMIANYEEVCGGKNVWDNIVIVVPKVDYNPANDSFEDWQEEIKEKERECIKVIFDKFNQYPLGCIAIS